MTRLASDVDQVVAGAAMIGGISYFYEFAYDLLAENERISAATFDAAVSAHRRGRLQKITVLSSSMVFESSTDFPTPEGAAQTSPPPRSTYGFQKLATEYFARGANEQYGLPYTIVRPFNCVGIGERRALRDREVMSGNVRLAMESERALNQDFNLSTARSTTVRELAEIIWRKVHGPSVPMRLVSDAPYEYDVQMRVPDVSKAREVLGFEATTRLEEVLDEVIPWIRDEIAAERI